MRTQLRQAQPEDIKAISELSRQMWFDDTTAKGHEFSTLTAMNDTLHLVREATYSQVAISQEDGTLLGALLARVDGDKPQVGDPSRLESAFMATTSALSATDHGRNIVNYLSQDRADTERMTSDVRKETGAELLLFILSEKARGHGLGSRLYDGFLAHLREHGVEGYYLYTDSTCSYGFYDHRGLRRVAEHVGAPTVDGGHYDKFVYHGKVS
ncbi:MAG: GNAT family N-acetyltransferase [Bifidobacteriaceae bacterium]|nr:GNAT family N-acetyltransferase [Bifidobacteriaceae bacterium]